jgi:farnesyl diphosphate synthase
MSTTLEEFESVWPRIVADLQDHCKQYKLPQQSLDWFTQVLPEPCMACRVPNAHHFV